MKVSIALYLLGAVLTAASPMSMAQDSEKRSTDVDNLSRGDYDRGGWAKLKRSTDVDKVSSGDYSRGGWARAIQEPSADLMASDVDDMCQELTSSGGDVTGVPVHAIKSLCSLLVA